MVQANCDMVSKDLAVIMHGIGDSPTKITEAAGDIVRLAKSSVPEGAGPNDPVLQQASECLVELAKKGHNVGYIRDLLQVLGDHSDPNHYDKAPKTRICGPIIYEG